MALPQDADDALIRQDIAEVDDNNDIISQKIDRANEDATGQFRDLFLNNVDFTTTLPDFYIQIVTEYATSLFWVKSNGTQQSIDMAKGVYEKAEKILIQRFQPVGSRV